VSPLPDLQSRNNAWRAGLIFLLWLAWGHPCPAAEIASSADPIAYREGRFILSARETALGDIVRAIGSRYDVAVSGLQDRLSQPVTVTITGGSLEEVIKRLLRHLGVKNYALEFTQERLCRVSVLPAGGRQPVASAVPEAAEPPPSRFVKAVVIQSIVEGSQAEKNELQPGDLVISYDDVRIRSARQLVDEVKQRGDRGLLEMVILRDDTPVSIFLDAGFIGIRIQETEIPQEKYNSLFPEG
jgi:hypothetical protein